MTEPFDAVLWRHEATNVKKDEWYRDTYVWKDRLMMALDALDRERAAAAAENRCTMDSQAVNTYANALQIENAGLWRELAAAQASLTLERAALGWAKDALEQIRSVCGFINTHYGRYAYGIADDALGKMTAARAATEGEGV